MIILVRGLPGSGKSTYAKNYVKNNNFIHIESDEWFISNGVYKFNPKDLTLAHRFCALRCEYFIKNGNNVIISNTFIRLAECAPYFVISQKYKINIDIITCLGEYKSIHNVPEEKLEQMRLLFEPEEKIKTLAKMDLQHFFNDPYDSYNHF